MRRLLALAALAVTLSGCQLRDVFSARADVAAEAGEAELASERLGAILAGPKELQPSTEAAEFVTNLWVDYALLAQALARGEDLTDSAVVAEVMWPELAELKGVHWHDTLMARRGSLTAGQVDSAYGGDLRVFQHILFRVGQQASGEERNAARQQAASALQQVRGGADFGGLAVRLSADGSAADSGYLPPSPRGAFVPAFDSAGWALAPGATSGVVETPFGYHIIRRPTLDEVRDRLREHIARVANEQLDTRYRDSLATANNLQVPDDAVSRIRAAVTEPQEHVGSSRTIATFDGGALTAGELVRWVSVLPPQYQAQIEQASDEDLKGFATVLGQNLLLLREAERNNIQVTPAEFDTVRMQYAERLDSLRSALRLGDDLTDSTVSESQRVEAAIMKVDQYFDRLIAGQAPFLPVPGALGSYLRSEADWDVNAAGLARGVQYAQRLKGDTTGSQPGLMQPAPGGAPIPGAQAPAAPAPGGAAPGAGAEQPAP